MLVKSSQLPRTLFETYTRVPTYLLLVLLLTALYCFNNIKHFRINFFHPGATMGTNEPRYPSPEATFLKEVTYKSSNIKEQSRTLRLPFINWYFRFEGGILSSYYFMLKLKKQ